MPWLETDPMDQRTVFIADHRLGLYEMTELCGRYGISRKTGSKWLGRFAEEGHRGLADRSRAPHHCPHRIAADLAELLCATRRKHPDWGAGKLLDYLDPRHPDVDWPAISTVNNLLARHDLLQKRRRRRPHQPPGVVPPTTAAPNDLWTADFKGQFPTRDGVWCYPAHDRRSAHPVPPDGPRAGLHPEGRGTGGLRARLSDLRPARRHSHRQWGALRHLRHPRPVPAERGVDALGDSASAHSPRPPATERGPRAEAPHLEARRDPPTPGQRRGPAAGVHRFRTEDNEERPHATWHGQTPASRYRPSPRVLPPQEYPGHFLVQRITNAGTFRFQHRLLFIANALKQHHIGLEQVNDGIWAIYFNTVLLAKLDERDFIIRG